MAFLTKDLIDRYTQIDELMRKNQILLSELLEAQKITNRLLVIQMKAQPDEIIRGYPEAGIDLAGILGGGAARYTSFMFEYPNQVIVGELDIYNEKHGGGIQEIIFLSDSALAANAVYSVQIMADDKRIYNDSYSNFAIKSDYETDMTAFEDLVNSRYVLTFQNVFFNESCYIRVYNSTATFIYIILKIAKRLEAGID